MDNSRWFGKPTTDEERALLDAIFGDGPGPRRPAVPPERVISDWIGSTQDAIAALRAWLGSLQKWQRNGGRELAPGDFRAAFRRLADAMGDGWADDNPAGGGLDRLAEVVEAGPACLCNEPGSPAAGAGDHAAWCPAKG